MVAPLFPVVRAPRFASLLNEFFEDLPQATENGSSQWEGRFSAPLALWEDESQVYLEIDMPGVASEGLDVTVEKGLLQIAAQRKAAESERKVIADHRRYGKFEHLLKLPEHIDADSVQAELHDGVLTITLAKKPQVQPKRIEVRTG